MMSKTDSSFTFPFFLAVCSVISVVASSYSDFAPETYRCVICLQTAKIMKEQAPASTRISFNDACRSFYGGADVCDDSIFSGVSRISNVATEESPREFCRLQKLCPTEEAAYKSADYVASLDFRVSKAVGTKSYDQLRVSVVSNGTIDSPYFTYSEQFKYRWTDKYLSTGLVSVTPGETKTINIAGNDINLFMPKQNEGVRGVIIADPCFQSEWIICLYQKSLDTFNHTIELLNAMNMHDDVHYYQILGDNFYDQDGAATASWFEALSIQSKSKFFATVPGNHDYWVNSQPDWYVQGDQLGNGFMQYYGIDTLAATDKSPFDFSVDPDDKNPDDPNRGAYNIPPANNFFYYNQLGNTGFIGFSGAHAYGDMKPYFVEACKWAAAPENNIDVVLLGGHWHSEGTGCEESSTTPEVYEELKALPECAPIANKLKYFEGHKHCNEVRETDVGFMVGGMGMTDAGCGGALGLPIVDTTGGSFKVYYFPIQNLKIGQTQNQYDEVLECLRAKGVSQCYHLATKWSEVPF